MLKKIVIILLLWSFCVEASEYSFVTYNVWFDKSTSIQRVPKLLDIISKENPDIVAFQEVEMWFVDDYLKHHSIIENYTITMKKTLNSIEGGLIFLSKKTIKIEKYKYFKLFSNMGREALSMTLNLNGKKVSITNIHLESYLDDTQIRVKQLKSIFSNITCENSILLGDFNFGDGELENDILAKRYTDVYKKLKKYKSGYTWNKEKSLLAKRNSFADEKSRRLDKIYIKGKNLTPTGIKIIGTKPFMSDVYGELFPSDHFGLLGKILVR